MPINKQNETHICDPSYAHQFDTYRLSQALKEAIEKYDKTTADYQAAQRVQQAARSVLRRTLSEDEITQWKTTVMLTLKVLTTPKTQKIIKNMSHSAQDNTQPNPNYLTAIRLLKENAEQNALGKPHYWKRWMGALTFLVGVIIMGLSIGGIPFTGGASLIGCYVAGGLLSVGGAACFYYHRQKSLSKQATNLAKTLMTPP